MYRVSLGNSFVSLGHSAGRRRMMQSHQSRRRWLSDKQGGSATGTPKSFPTRSTSGPMEFKNAAEKHEYLTAANKEMERYHNARELLRQGKLKPKNSTGQKTESGSFNTGMAQLGVVTLFLMAFMATPLIGKRIAQDEEFRRMMPSWFDFTVPKPEKPWTREELHEQM